MTRVLLATFCLLPDGEAGGELLLAALAERGVEARWAVWDDPAVDWASADLVAVRSTWDYHRRCAEFLAWARSVERSTRLLNGADAFAWNADKAYLLDLGGVATVPTSLVEDPVLVPTLAAALERWGTVVVKPRTGAGGVGVVVADRVDDPRLEGLVAGPWVAQPLVESVRTAGESSVHVLGGVPVSQVDKRPAGGEIRVHELYGGHAAPAPLDPARAEVARAAVAAAAARLGAAPSYARVDLVELAGAWVVSELELIEPGLYLDVVPGLAGRFADLVVAELDRL
ncbi:ATP-grasp domain-containing protein [Nocardioides sp. SYSU DS0663]|uniref:ATP-grasp domain-containing protein n=1 Tax=Nocardioides sp. SYSU DS0663 TaxID=3416445 RepID=UPI003F4B7337